ncbi:MAG: hypothetical protein WAQ75_09240, partial [Propionicimonas sp.]
GLRPSSRPRSRVPLFLGVTVGLLVVALVGVFLLGGGVGGALGLGAPIGAQKDSAPLAVRGYLEALAAGDSATALSYARTTPSDTSLLTDEILQHALRETPLTGIDVNEGSGSTQQTVLARYLLGSTPVTAAYGVTKSGATWLLDTVTADFDVSSLGLGTVPLALNGVPLTTDRPALFPGSYTLTSGTKRFGVRNGSFVVESPDDRPDPDAIRFSLTTSGRTEIIKAAKARLTTCLATREGSPKGCGFGLEAPQGVKMTWSTLRWRVTSGATALASMKPALAAADPGTATASVRIKVRGDVRSRDGRSWYGSSLISTVEADLTGDDVVVRFGG